MINQRKRRWLGHVLRHDVSLRDVLEGRMTGKRTRGRKRLQLMSNICEGYEKAKKRAEDRCLWCVSVMGVIDLLLQQNTRRRRVLQEKVESTDLSVGCRVRVQAVNAVGVGAFSIPIKVTTRALPPYPPVLELVSVGANSVKLKWGDGKNVDLLRYVLEMRRDDYGRYLCPTFPRHRLTLITKCSGVAMFAGQSRWRSLTVALSFYASAQCSLAGGIMFLSCSSVRVCIPKHC